MNKKILLVLISILIIFAFASDVTAGDVNDTANGGNTIIVDGSSTNQMNNPTIQNAINNATAGDTIQITGKSYEHCHIVVDKQLTIISEVNTQMSPCPSNIQESDGVGVFYFNKNSSGSILKGFTFTNYVDKRGTTDPYGVYVNGAENIMITDCIINAVSEGPGIYINNASNIVITKTKVSNAVNAIYVTNTTNIKITDNTIQYNTESGVNIGENVINTNIINNTINSNKWKGILFNSCINGSVISNIITNNRDNTIQTRATNGAGIFVNATIENLKVKGNLIAENGNYGLFNSYVAVPSIVDETIEEIDQNFFMNHITRGIYSQLSENCAGNIYTGSNVFSVEQICPSTYYEVGVKKDGSRDMIFSRIQEVSPGIYNISFIRKDTGAIATYLNTVDVTFFLNKATYVAAIEKGDTAKVVRVVNGTATVNFTDSKFKSKDNTIIAISPGFGAIDFKLSADRLSAIYYVPDSNVPEGSVTVESELKGIDLTKYSSSPAPYTVTLKDGEGNPIVNQNITISINGVKYIRTTNESGIAKLNINLGPNTYNVNVRYDGSADYPAANSTNTITVLSTVNGEDITKMYRNGTQYYATFRDANGRLLKNTNVTFNINGVFYTRTTNDYGVARLNINLIPSEYIITATNPSTKEKKSNIITVLPTVTENNDLVKYYRNASQYTVKLLDSTGKALANSNVTFNINGVFYTRTSNSSGYAKLNINLIPGDYIITARNGNCAVSNNIKVLPLLNADDLVKGYGTADPFKVKLLNGSGDIVPNANVSFNINGVFYTRTSNSEGIASLNINLIPGHYIITSDFRGAKISNTIDVLKTIDIPADIENTQIQSIINNAPGNVALNFRGSEYNDISLTVNKNILLTGNNTILNGAINKNVITVNDKNALVKNLIIVRDNGEAIVGISGQNNIILEREYPELCEDGLCPVSNCTTDDNNVSICPSLNANPYVCTLTYIGEGKYNASFCLNTTCNTTDNETDCNTTACDDDSCLPLRFTYYFVLNAYTDHQQEIAAKVYNSSVILKFNKENYLTSNNIIEGSLTSIYNTDKAYRVAYTYNVSDSEIYE